MKISAHIFGIILFILAIFHSSLFFQNYLQISGNYEFTKTLLFLFLGSIFLIIHLLRKKIKAPYIGVFFIFIVIISTIFSVSPFTSFFGSTNKGHSLILFILLFFLFSYFLGLKQKQRKIILQWIFATSMFVCIFAIKEYFFPAYNYGTLANRAIGTLGHPSYIGLYILMITPFISEKIFNHKNYTYVPLLVLMIVSLVLTKHIFSISLFLGFVLYFFYQKKLFFLYTFSLPIICILGIGSIFLYFPEKVHSLVSRYYIWETSLKIIFSSVKTFFLGNGTETLIYFFSSFKSPELYIFENFGYTADRAHNILLDYWYSFGIGGVIFLGYILFFIIKNFKKNPYYESIVLFFIFNLLNFPSLLSYILVLFFLSKIIEDKKIFFTLEKKSINIFFIILGLCMPLVAGKYYVAENYAFRKNYESALQYFPTPEYYFDIFESEKGRKIETIKSQNYYKSKIYTLKNEVQDCHDFTSDFPSVENYFFCGNLFYNLKEPEIATEYYMLGLKKLPDLWNQNSPYWKNYFVKNTITGNRFFSEKFSDLDTILSRIGIKNELGK